MAAANCLLCEDRFLCPICLEVFTSPVTTSCGHNFCKSCITTNWNLSVSCKCPMCKTVFNSRPELQTNTFISEMVAQFRQEAEREAEREAQQEASGLKRHPLTAPVDDMEGRMCTEHYRPLELFCRTDGTGICELCPVTCHLSHDVVPLQDEYEEKKVELLETDAEIRQMVLDRRLKVEEVKQLVELGKEDADQAIAEGVELFTSLSEVAERGLIKLIETVEGDQAAAQERAEASIQELEREISVLQVRAAEIEQLAVSEDRLPFLRRFPSVNAAPPGKDWSAVGVHPLYKGMVVRALAELEETVSRRVTELLEAELRWVQQYTTDVTLDPDTAHPLLVLSDDGKQVAPGDSMKSLPINPERFSVNPCVLGRQGFSAGRFYFVVGVRGKSEWDVGVARESISRKEDVPLSPGEGYWAVWLRKRTKYKGLADPPVALPLRSRPSRVGVFVDYEQGVVQFYDVDAPGLIYSFTGCSFSGKLFPYFNPGLTDGGKNSSPLVVSP